MPHALLLQYLDNTLSPYPGRIGDGSQAALLASNGDGIHSVGATLGPLVAGNTLVNMGDDGITVHGVFFLVVQVLLLLLICLCLRPETLPLPTAPARCCSIDFLLC